MKLQSASLAACLCMGHAWAAVESPPLEEIIVQASGERRTIELDDTYGLTPDTATLLKRAAGADVASNGPITGTPTIRGMSRFRVATHVDGAVISPGGPNWMDPPLSYAPAVSLDRLSVHRGIAPVSAAAESIGGLVTSESWFGEFTDTTTFSGRFRSGWASANQARMAAAVAVLAGAQHKLAVSAMAEQADDVDFDGGRVLPSEYTRDRTGVHYSARAGDHTVAVAFTRVNTGDAGTSALPMDIAYIDSDLASIRYAYAPQDNRKVELQLYASDIDHGMSNYHLRNAPAAAAMWRRNITAGDNRGLRLTATLGELRFGADYHAEVHESDISNPNAPMFFVTNFDNARRSIAGLFLENTWQLANRVSVEAGVRANRVSSDADPVNATPAVLGMPPAVLLRDRFNAADRSEEHTLIDAALRVRAPVSEALALYAGASRKSRAPAYQERFLWLPLQATAGLADGRTYTGNLDLDPEVATDIEIGLDWRTERFVISPRFYYRHVDDFITGQPTSNAAARMFVAMMGGSEPLEFANLDARFFGLDVDWQLRIGDYWRLEGVIDYVRADRRSGGGSLYRIPPLNGLIAATYERPRWSVSGEVMAYARQDRVARINGESETPGYALLNLAARWHLTENIRLNLGVDNVTDRRYRDHLAGINRVAGNPALGIGERIPGNGRSTYVRLDISW